MGSRLVCNNTEFGTTNKIQESVLANSSKSLALFDKSQNTKIEIEYSIVVDGVVDKLETGRITLLWDLEEVSITSFEQESSGKLGNLENVNIEPWEDASNGGITIENNYGEQLVFTYYTDNKFNLVYTPPVLTDVYIRDFTNPNSFTTGEQLFGSSGLYSLQADGVHLEFNNDDSTNYGAFRVDFNAWNSGSFSFVNGQKYQVEIDLEVLVANNLNSDSRLRGIINLFPYFEEQISNLVDGTLKFDFVAGSGNLSYNQLWIQLIQFNGTETTEPNAEILITGLRIYEKEY